MSKPSSTLLFGLLCLVAAAFWILPLRDTIGLALHQDAYAHILLIVPISAALIFVERKSCHVDTKLSFRAAALLALAILIALFATRLAAGASSQLALRMAALVLLWIGSFVLCFGWRCARSMPFPLLFLLWAIPLPDWAIDRIVALLQQGSALVAQALFALARVPVTREGVILLIPGLEIEVAAECSSIRSSVMLVVTTMVLAQLFLHAPWRKLLVMAVSIPLCFVKNGLRIFTLAMLGTRVDPTFLTGSLHHHGGIVFLFIALAGIGCLIWILRRGEMRSAAHSLGLLRPV